jgi:predicted nucleotidyltransferase
MDRIEAIASLTHYAQAIKAMGATSLYVFGSTARDEATKVSDLDLFIDSVVSQRCWAKAT